jgi:hypothetical protein
LPSPGEMKISNRTVREGGLFPLPKLAQMRAVSPAALEILRIRLHHRGRRLGGLRAGGTADANGRHKRVLLLEAGGSDRRFFVQMPLGYGKTFYDKSCQLDV